MLFEWIVGFELDRILRRVPDICTLKYIAHFREVNLTLNAHSVTPLRFAT